MIQVMEMNKPPFKFKFVNMSALKNNPATEVKCHICGQSGHLYECSHCPRSYHIMCVPSTIEISPDGWRCMYHFCSECGNNVDYSEPDLFHCENCLTSYCSKHKNQFGLPTIGEEKDHTVLCKQCKFNSGVSEPPRKKFKRDPTDASFISDRFEFPEGERSPSSWRQNSNPGQLNSRLNEDPSEENFKSEPNSPTSAEASTPTGSASNFSENSLQSRISATASRNLVSALKDMMKVTKKNQKIISHEIGISTTTLSGLVTGKRRTKGWKTLEYKLVKWILSQTVERASGERNAEYQRNVQTCAKIQRGFRQYIEDVHKNRDSDKFSERGSSSSPDPSLESPRNTKPKIESTSASGQATQQNAIKLEPGLSGSNTNEKSNTTPFFYSQPQVEYYAEYSGQQSNNTNQIPIANQPAPFRPDEIMYDRLYDEEARQFQHQIPPQMQNVHPGAVEYLHERYDVQRTYVTYTPTEYSSATDPQTHTYGPTGAAPIYRPNYPYQGFYIPQQQTPMVAQHTINLQPAQPTNMNAVNYSNVPPMSQPVITNYGNQNVHQTNEENEDEYDQ